MILKILEAKKSSTGEPMPGEWWVFDNIRRVKIKQSYKCTKAVQEEWLKEHEYIDAVLTESVANAAPDDLMPAFRELGCRLEDNSEYSLIFDVVAYLCNDEGKTIEKIVV